MDSIKAQFSIITPMFIGDWDSHTDTPQLRPPSIKGALRFLWRALRWQAMLEQCNNNNELALNELHSQEANLFGSAADPNDLTRGQSRVQIRLVEQTRTTNKVSDWPKNNAGGAGYLGYDLDSTKGGDPHRCAIQQGQFTLQLILKNGVNDLQKQQLTEALKLWGMVGGLGSRSRRGFGSVAITELDGVGCLFASREKYKEALVEIIKPKMVGNALPPFTTFSKHTRLSFCGSGNDYAELMDRVGQNYKIFRSNLGKVIGKVPLGLPLANYDEKNRRCSPLFYHLNPIGKDSK